MSGHVLVNDDTNHVYEAIVNYEPSYLVVREIAARWNADQTGPIAPYRDELKDYVEANAEEIWLSINDDLTDAVDYAAIIAFEAGEE